MAVPAGHEGLEDGEEDIAVFGHAALFPDDLRVDAHPGVLGKGGEVVECLIREDVAVGEEENPGLAAGLAGFPGGQAPAGVEELPGNLEGDGGFAGAGGQCQENSGAAVGDGFQHLVDGVVLVVAGLPKAAFFLEGGGAEAGPPGVGIGEGGGPEVVRGGKCVNGAFRAGVHVHPVDVFAVGGEGEAGLKAFGVAFGLGQSFGGGEVAAFGFDHAEFLAMVKEDVISDFRGGPPARALEAARGEYFPPDAAAGDDAPSGSFQGGVDEFGAGFGFVHFSASKGSAVLT